VKFRLRGWGDGEWCGGVIVKTILETGRCGETGGVVRRLKAGACESICAVKWENQKFTKQTNETRHFSNKYLKNHIYCFSNTYLKNGVFHWSVL